MNTPPATRLLVFAGSTRLASFNRKLAHVAAQMARASGAEVTHIELADFDIPMYNADLGKRGFIHVELWRLGWDGLQGGFCGKYREYLQENQRSRPPKPGDHEPR